MNTTSHSAEQTPTCEMNSAQRGAHRGREAIRRVFAEALGDVPVLRPEIKIEEAGNVVFVSSRTRRAGQADLAGADTFVIERERIAVHTGFHVEAAPVDNASIQGDVRAAESADLFRQSSRNNERIDMAEHTNSTERVTTPFGAESTAREVLEGIDLSGKRMIVTGASSGIGVETARALAGAGAEVTLAVRDTDAGERAASDITRTTGDPSLHVAPLDLADRSSVAAFVTSVPYWKGPSE